MSYSKYLVATFVIGISTVSCASQPYRYECPAFLVDGQAKHSFSTVELFEGPPQNKGALMGGETKDGVEWPASKNSDLYMICGYRDTGKTITVHAPGVSICQGTQSPLAAYCD